MPDGTVREWNKRGGLIYEKSPDGTYKRPNSDGVLCPAKNRRNIEFHKEFDSICSEYNIHANVYGRIY